MSPNPHLGFAIARSVELALAADGQPPTWVHVLPAGRWRGQDGRGPYRLDDPAGVIAASLAAAPGGRLVVDLDHSTDLAAPHGRPAPAAGWIDALEARADGLWARVAWTARGQAAIASLEYRFVSPAFDHEPDGAIQRIRRVSLVNNPNFLALTALAAARPAAAPFDPLAFDPVAVAAAARAHQQRLAGLGIAVTAAEAVERIISKELT